MNGMVKIGLLPRIIIGIAVGIGVGYVAPMWVARICATFNAVFGQFLGFLIPLIIVGFVAPAIADLGKRAGGMLYRRTRLCGYVYRGGVIVFHRGMVVPIYDFTGSNACRGC